MTCGVLSESVGLGKIAEKEVGKIKSGRRLLFGFNNGCSRVLIFFHFAIDKRVILV